MYSLENNVAWTSELKDAFKKNITRGKVIYDETEYTESDFLKNIKIEEPRYVPDVGFIGQAVSRMVTITLINDNETNINFENADFEVKIGADYNNNSYYINYGNFIVDAPPENDDTNGTVTFYAYDYMIKFNKPYEDRVSYPCTLLDLLEDICNQAGVVLMTRNFANYNFIVTNNQFNGKTLRDVLRSIAKSAFSWARIGQDNGLYLDFVVNNTINETITPDDYEMDSFKKANQYYGPINKVTFADSDITGEEQSVSDAESIALYGKRELIIYDNYFAYSTEKRQELIQAGTRLFGLRYMPIQQLNMIGLAYLDSNDVLGIEDKEQNVFLTRNFNHTIEYNGVLHDKIETSGTSETQEEYVNENSSVNNSIKISRSVDRSKRRNRTNDYWHSSCL